MAKTTLITGATRGIGRATAECIAARGAKVIGVARSAPENGKFPGQFYAADLADEASTSAAL